MPDVGSAGDQVVALLAESARSGGCPTCRVIARLLYDEMCRLQYDAATNPVVRQAVAVDGLCGDHLWYLFDLAGSDTVAEILRPVLGGVADQAGSLGERIARDPGVLRRGRDAIARRLVAADCVACRSVRAWEEAIVRATAAKMAKAPQSFPGDRLCVLHIGPVVEALPAALASELLVRWADSTRVLGDGLDVVTAKKHSGDRSVGPERYAPAEAIARLAGGRGSGRAPR